MLTRDIRGVLFEIESPSYWRVKDKAMDVYAEYDRCWYIRALVKGNVLKSLAFPNRQSAVDHVVALVHLEESRE